MMVNALPGRTSMGRAIFIPRWMSSDEVWPSCWPTAVPRTSSALGPPKASPQVRDPARLDARADDLQQQRATEDADRVLVHLVAEPAAPVASLPGRTRCLLASRACRRWFQPHTQSDFRQLDATTRE